MGNKALILIKDIADLSKFKITLAVTVTTALGYLLAIKEFTYNIFPPVIGLFLIACSSAVLNHYQEYNIDKKMIRTRNRPIPSGRIKPLVAIVISVVYIVLGSLLLYRYGGLLPLQLGLLALIWYNGIYTPLKRKTPFAVIPGSVIGAIPPVVGWVSGGGELFDREILIIAFFIFMWQIPHFWILLLKHGKDYNKAGLPTITELYTETQVKIITFIWTFATAISGLLIPLYGKITALLPLSILIVSSILLIIFFSKLLLPKRNNSINIIKYFGFINAYLLVVLVAVAIDSLMN
ncbi:MAG: protoheme IX farnesyltransferase [Hyphomicrobiales bacterium]